MSTTVAIQIADQGKGFEFQVVVPPLPKEATPKQALEYLVAKQLATALIPHVELLANNAMKTAQDKLPKILALSKKLHQQGVCDDQNATQH